MARLVRHDRNVPYQVKTNSGETLWICACGLSNNKPFCDGSHKRTQDEDPKDLYVYQGSSRIRLDPLYM